MEDVLLYVNSFEKLFKTFHINFLIDIVIFLLITTVLYKLATVFTTNLKNKLTEKDSQMLRFVPSINRTVKGLILFFMVATFLQSHGYSMASFIAGFGITGLAIGFAAKETIANIFGAIAIISDRSYKLGDYIVVNNMEGTVEDINMRSTRIRATDNAVIILPNSMVASSIITNITAIKKRRIIETLSITYDTSNEKLKRAINILKDILQNNAEVSKDFSVYLEKLDSSSINLKIRAFVKTNNFDKFSKIKEDVLLETIKQFREENIDFAYPYNSLGQSNTETKPKK